MNTLMKRIGVAALTGIAAASLTLIAVASPAAAEDEAEIGISVTVVEPTPAPTGTTTPTQAPSPSPAPAGPGAGAGGPALPPTGMPQWVFTAAWIGGALVLSGAGTLALARRREFLMIESETAP